MENPYILLVSPPGSSRDGLYIMLPALMGQVRLMTAVNSIQAASLAIKELPDLIIINTEIGYNESKRVLTRLLALEIEIKIIVLSEAIQWQRWKKNPQSCQVLLKGFSSQEFMRAIEISLTK
jgi:two-component SAPR family response regulator